jgi:nucleoside-diphosphate-sugar epimerase
MTVGQTADKIKSITGYSGDIVKGFPAGYPDRPVVEEYLSLDATKASNILGWKPLVSIDEGLKRTVEYWKTKG